MVDSCSINQGTIRDPATPVDSMGELESVNQRLSSGDDSAIADLIRILERGVHFFLRRANGSKSSDRHNQETVMRIVLSTAERAQRGQYPNASAMCSHVLIAVRAACAAKASRVVSIKREVFAEQPAANREICLDSLTEIEREAVRRYYLLRQEPEEICKDLCLERQHLDSTFARLRQRAGRAQSPSRHVKTFSIGA